MKRRRSYHWAILTAGVAIAVASWWLPLRFGAALLVVVGLALYLTTDERLDNTENLP